MRNNICSTIKGTDFKKGKPSIKPSKVDVLIYFNEHVKSNGLSKDFNNSYL